MARPRTRASTDAGVRLAAALFTVVASACAHRGDTKETGADEPITERSDLERPDLVPLPFEDARGFFGYRDAQGKVVIPAMFAVAEEFRGTTAPVAFVVDKDVWRCIDTRGQSLALPFNFDNGPDPVSAGRSRALSTEGLIYFMDEGCKRAFSGEWKFATSFVNDLAFVCHDCAAQQHGEHASYQGQRWQVIDQRGQYLSALESETGPAWRDDKRTIEVTVGGERKILDRDGRLHALPDLRFVRWEVQGLDPRFVASALRVRSAAFDRCIGRTLEAPLRVIVAGRVGVPKGATTSQLQASLSSLVVSGLQPSDSQMRDCIELETRAALTAVYPVVAEQGWLGGFLISMQLHPGDVPASTERERSDARITLEEDGTCVVHHESPCAPNKSCMGVTHAAIRCPEDLGIAAEDLSGGGIDRSFHLRLRLGETGASSTAPGVGARVSLRRRRDACEIEWELEDAGAQAGVERKGVRFQAPILCGTFDVFWKQARSLSRARPTVGRRKEGAEGVTSEGARRDEGARPIPLRARLDLLWMSGRATAYQADDVEWPVERSADVQASRFLCELSALAKDSAALAAGWNKAVVAAPSPSESALNTAASLLPMACARSTLVN